MCTQLTIVLGCKCNCQGQSPSFFFAGKQSPSLTSLDKRDYYTCCTQYSNPGSHASQNTTSGVVPKGRVLDLGNLALCAHWQASFFWTSKNARALQRERKNCVSKMHRVRSQWVRCDLGVLPNLLSYCHSAGFNGTLCPYDFRLMFELHA
jgi:hypothetical protein